MDKIRIGAIASGSGSNFEAIVEATESGNLKEKAQVVLLLSNKPGAYCIERAKNHNIPYALIESDTHKGTREEFDAKMIEHLDKYQCELIVLVGYMRFVSKMFIDHFNGKVMNIHPALLPSFKGMHAHEDALKYGVKVSGVTVHFVDPLEDHGPIIIQKCVPVYSTDTQDTLGVRILKWEHKAFPKAIELFCDGRLHVDGRIVRIDNEENLSLE
ncbi:MAG: Phosphoribosylglycinamide formyltransferase [Promethearchaeota archaeon]|nr:MAG: Phosphoribosylglycinamide formyltransferase [Candidatus Lokiarchaeota archaeon]